jgi:conserved oligomeric Golgi complex subunit 8
MITQLLQELKNDLTLPKCLQLIGYLRRMQAFSSSELKLKFIQARDCWFRETLSVIPKSNPQQHLSRTIEVTRVNLFSIATQYKALFNEDFGTETNSCINLMFSSWMYEKIDEFLRTLESDLEQSNASLMDISSILAQCMYFGVSFSKIGFDFRARLTPIFIKNVSKYIQTSIVKVTKQFESDMETFTLINKDIASFKRNLTENSEKTENSPPQSLLEFNPLAIYCNSLINILNELRIFSPTAIVEVFVVSIEVSLENVAKLILSFYRSEHQVFGVKEKENFLKMCTSFAFDLFPFIQHCINLIFPPNNKIIQNIESITCLNSKKILESIENFLPEVKA